MERSGVRAPFSRGLIPEKELFLLTKAGIERYTADGVDYAVEIVDLPNRLDPFGNETLTGDERTVHFILQDLDTIADNYQRFEADAATKFIFYLPLDDEEVYRSPVRRLEKLCNKMGIEMNHRLNL
jgi:hypothetical protein